MKQISVKVNSNVGDVIAAKDEAVAAALEAIGLQAEGDVALLAPVDTGRLRASITHEVDGDAVNVGTDVEYASYVEYGTSKTKAQPFLEPAITENMDSYQQIAESYLKG